MYMKKLQQFIRQQRANYGRWDVAVFTVLTLLSIANGQTTVFYLLYFFWWNELLCISIDRIFYKKNPQAVVADNGKKGIFSSLFMMAIYWVFIVVFFGFFSVATHTELLTVNMQVLFFHNWFFNANLLFVIVERIYLHTTHQQVHIGFGGFTLNMLVLHISIVLGGILLFFIVKPFPNFFTPENLWGSVLIALPFLLLNMARSYYLHRMEGS